MLYEQVHRLESPSPRDKFTIHVMITVKIKMTWVKYTNLSWDKHFPRAFHSCLR